eukprot:gene3407-14794_t
MLGAGVCVGDVVVYTDRADASCEARVHFVGPTHDGGGVLAGIEVLRPLRGAVAGKHDGCPQRGGTRARRGAGRRRRAEEKEHPRRAMPRADTAGVAGQLCTLYRLRRGQRRRRREQQQQQAAPAAPRPAAGACAVKGPALVDALEQLAGRWQKGERALIGMPPAGAPAAAQRPAPAAPPAAAPTGSGW